jgi:hypothetical protein
MNNQASTSETEKKLVPPYMSWKTFLGFIISLRQGIPTPIDTSSMLLMSGSNRSWTMGTLRFLHLITQDNYPENQLYSFVEATKEGNEEQFQDQLKSLLEKAYPFLFEQGYDLKTSSPASFSQKFKDAGLSGTTIQKAERFFLEAAKTANIAISPYILGARKRGVRSSSAITSSKTRTKKNAPKSKGRTDNIIQTLVSKFPEFDPNWAPDAQKAWFDMYDRLIDKFEGKEEEESKEGDT